jgi:hypothetical protein
LSKQQLTGESFYIKTHLGTSVTEIRLIKAERQ